MSWPEGRVAVAFTFDFDAEEGVIADDPANADRPGALSQGTFAAKVGVPLVLDALDRCGVRATFFVPGRVAERHPERVADIVGRGHEVGHHGYTHTSPTSLSPEDDERELVLGHEAKPSKRSARRSRGTDRPRGTSARRRSSSSIATGSRTRRT